MWSAYAATLSRRQRATAGIDGAASPSAAAASADAPPADAAARLEEGAAALVRALAAAGWTAEVHCVAVPPAGCVAAAVGRALCHEALNAAADYVHAATADGAGGSARLTGLGNTSDTAARSTSQLPSSPLLSGVSGETSTPGSVR